jgi:FixJ family two-component response regulator
LHLTEDGFPTSRWLLARAERCFVLVVDDDAMSAEAFANHSDFNGVICVVLDINLGDVSGIEVRRRLKEANNSVPVIYITVRQPNRPQGCASFGCLAYLTKPFSAKSLIEPLHRAASGLE